MKVKLVQIVKLIIALFAITACALEVAVLVENFFSTDKWTWISSWRKEPNIMFLPNILICNSNQINATRARELGINEENLERLIQGTTLAQKWDEFSLKLKGE